MKVKSNAIRMPKSFAIPLTSLPKQPLRLEQALQQYLIFAFINKTFLAEIFINLHYMIPILLQFVLFILFVLFITQL